MKSNAGRGTALALALGLLLAACGGQGALPSSAPPPGSAARAAEPLPPAGSPSAPPETALPGREAPVSGEKAPAPPEGAELAEDAAPALERLGKTEWPVVSIDLESFGLTAKSDDERFMYIMAHTDTVPLDQLIVFDLWGDALTEGSSEELRSRFLEAPDTVLAYLVLMGDQRVDYWNQPPAAEVICYSIASADAAWHGGTEEFARTLAACRENYPSGRIAELLDVLEREHAASMERNCGQNG